MSEASPKRAARAIGLALAILLAAPAALARPTPATPLGGGDELVCGFERGTARVELADLSERILSAESLEAARRIATSDSRFARDVLQRARLFAPGSESLQLAAAKLDAFHVEVAAASTRADVAASFDDLTRSAPGVDVGCHYSGGEVIAILLGLLLGIIPGLILMILLC